MSSPALESIAKLIAVARRLRTVAEELGNVELKSQIVDEISALQEIREQMVGGDETVVVASATTGTIQRVQPGAGHHSSGGHARPATLSGSAAMNIIQPTSDSGTYAFKADEPAAPSVGNGTGEGAAADPATVGMSPEQRAEFAEKRIAELEPSHQAAIKKMNDVLTPEQRRIKAQASKTGRELGKKGKELQDFVLASLHMTPEQRAKLSAAMKELAAIRNEIAKEVQFLLTDEQRNRVGSLEAAKEA